MIRIGIVTGREVKKNRDGQNDRLMLQVEISDPDDIQTVELMNPAGEDNNPPDGSKILILDLGNAYKVAVATDDGIAPSGKRRIYSTLSFGVIAAFINLLTNGDLELNGNADFAVRFTELETAFNELRDDYNLHKHGGVDTGAGTSGITDTISVADISGAKIDEIKVP